jgi:hypothetical protein
MLSASKVNASPNKFIKSDFMSHRNLWISTVGLLALAINAAAFGWGHEGHELIGSIADQLLDSNARLQVAHILGYELRIAAPWADCVRSVIRNSDGTFKYAPDSSHPEYTVPCRSFQTPAETARMEDYVARNWSNCFYQTAHGCDEAYHFDDVDVSHDHYDRAYAGTSDHDIVSAIKAALFLLEGKPVPAPFSIKDQKEALLMLAHFVGDIHQPLHVGTIYLDPNGNVINPDAAPPVNPSTNTAGGNFIHDQYASLHFEWDQIPAYLGRTADPCITHAAAAIPTSAGPPDNWAAAWASETILVARTAFAGTTYSSDGHGHWIVAFADRQAYWKTQEGIQTAQITKAGARLAQLLNAIWP